MSDLGEYFRDVRELGRIDKRKRLDRSANQDTLDEARALAAQHGMSLSPYDAGAYHYQLREMRPGGWIVNLYPSTGRIYQDANRPGPYLRVPRNWTLLDVVRAAAVCVKRGVKV